MALLFLHDADGAVNWLWVALVFLLVAAVVAFVVAVAVRVVRAARRRASGAE